MKRLIALLLTIIMVVSLCPFSAIAAGGAPNVTVNIDKTEVNEGDTVTVTLGIKEMTGDSIAFGFDFDKSLLEVTSVPPKPLVKLSYVFYYEGEAYPDDLGVTTISTKDEANNKGHVGVAWANDTEVLYTEKASVITVKFIAKAAGTVELKMFEDSSGTDGYKGNWTYPIPAPACTHENTKYVANNNGTHNIVCAAEGCGVTVKENENCSGGTATCAAKAKCVNCEAEYGVLAGHTYGNLIPATEKVHTKDELKASVAAHYFCDVCDTYFDTYKNVTTLAALTGETPVHTVDDEQTVTTTTKEPTCTEGGTEEVATFCSCGYAFTKYERPISVDSSAHNWGTPTYGWNSDNSYYQATRVCQIEACKKTETVNATVRSEQIADPTCGEAGQTKHTATFEEDWAHTQYWTEDLPGATGVHSYALDTTKGSDGYEWAADYSTCTAYGVCSCGATTSETVDSAFSVKADATCTSAEYRHYTADFQASWAEDQGGDFYDPTGAKDPNNHSSDGFVYENNYNGTHKKLNACCLAEVIANEDCSFDEDYRCTVCKNGCGHSDVNEKDHVCDYGCGKSDMGEHKSNAAHPCLDGKCDYCGKDVPATAKHEYDNECDVDCNVCYTDREVGEHKSNATYPCHDGKCVYCGIDMPATAEHSYKNACDADCDICGDGRVPADHVYDNDCDADCNTCGDKRTPADHELVYTDLKDGNHSVSCDVCKKTLVSSEAHNFKNDKHECACLVVETFTLTIGYFGDDGVYYEVKSSVPFDAPIAPYLPELNSHTEDDGSLYEFKAWLDSETLLDCPETMPAKDIEVYADYYYTGWNLYYSGSVYEGAVYVIHDEEQKTGWTKIGDDWYYLDTETGFRAEGLKRVPYPAESTGLSYTPNAEDLAYAGETFINADSAVFFFGTDGKFQSSFTGIVPSEDAPSSYAVKGMLDWHVGLVKFEGDYYYFSGNEETGMNVMKTGDVYVTRNTTEREVTLGGIYTFADDGKLIENNGIVDMTNGSKRYYEDAELMVGNGLTKVGENYIYVNRNGELIVNAEYWVPANTLGIVSGMYMFDENGFMVNPVPTTKNGVYFENGAWYCYVDGVKAYNLGLTSFEGTWYGADGEELFEDDVWIYVRSNGALATGTYYVTTVNHPDAPVDAGTKCHFNEYGILVEDLNGIVSENNSLYYYENNSIAYNKGVIEIDGNYYYVKSNGEVVNNREYWITNVGESGVVAKAYTFDENGVMLNPEFKGEEANGIVDGYYYVDGKIAYCAGLIELEDEDGKFYIYVRSNGQLATGKYWPTNKNGIDVKGSLDFGTDGKYYF